MTATWKVRAFALVGLLVATPTLAQGIPELIATSVAYYDVSKDECFYEPVVATQLAKLDELFSSSVGPAWEETKRQVALFSGQYVNMGKMQGSSPCRSYGIAIGQAVQLSMIYIGDAPGLNEAAARLMDGGGLEVSASGSPDPENERDEVDRIITEEEVARPADGVGEALTAPSTGSASRTGGWNSQVARTDLQQTLDNGELLFETSQSAPMQLTFRMEVLGVTSGLDHTLRVATTGDIQVGWEVNLSCATKQYRFNPLGSTRNVVADGILDAALHGAVDRLCNPEFD